MERAAAQREAGGTHGGQPEPEDGHDSVAPDLLTIGLLVFFVSLVVVVAAMLLVPAIL